MIRLFPPPGPSVSTCEVAGGVLIQAGDLDMAQRLLEQSLRLEPSAPTEATALEGLGLIWMCRGETSTARDFLGQALEVDPMN